MARILIVDDDEQLRAALRRALAFEGHEVLPAADGAEGLRLARGHGPDLVVLDVLMPGLDGFEVCRRLRAEGDAVGQAVPILMLTARDEIADRVEGLDAGADDYLVKPFAVDELLARVRALLRRRVANGQAPVLRFADLRLDSATREAMRGDRRIELSTKEYELLALFMRHPRQVLSRRVIFDQVWNYDFGNQSNLIEVYVGYLRQKLESAGEARLIHTVRGAGYVLRE
jgi:two-component system, OmpR family, response regulator MprA